MMCFIVSAFFLINLLSFVHEIDSSKDDEACFNLEDGLHHLGPCEEKVLHCAIGKTTFRSCPFPLLFNPGTKFCENLEEILKPLRHTTDIEHQPPSDSFSPIPVWSNTPEDDSSSDESVPFVGGISRSDHHSSESAESSKKSLPFVGNFVDSEEEENEHFQPSYTVFVPPIQRSAIRHTESGDVRKGAGESLPIVNRKLLDNFFGKHSRELHISEFAPINSPAVSGHDTFKAIPSTKAQKSGFAPFNSPMKIGHDVFKVRQRRSFSGETTTMDKCRLLNESEGFNRTNASSAVIECAAMEVPSGCRSFYVACVDGRQVQRFCPSGLFFNVEKESCDRWHLIARCGRTRVANPLKSPVVPPLMAVGRHPSASPLPQRTSPVASSPNRFCSELPNGFYRHPMNCSRIIQCFSNKIFEYPPCRFGLVFNERTGFCDYQRNVLCKE